MLELKTWLLSLQENQQGEVYIGSSISEKSLLLQTWQSICKVVDPWVHKSGQVIA